MAVVGHEREWFGTPSSFRAVLQSGRTLSHLVTRWEAHRVFRLFRQAAVLRHLCDGCKWEPPPPVTSHYIYGNYKAGKLGRAHLITAIKAAAAALIAYHEMKTAYGIAKSSNSKTLQVLIAPITALTASLSALSSKLKHGDTSQISAANSQESALQSTAGKNGYCYKDQQPSGFAGF